MEDNKLIYTVGFKLDEKSEKEVKKNFGQMQEEMRKLLDTIAKAVSYTPLRAHETPEQLVCRLRLAKKKRTTILRIITHIPQPTQRF